MKNTSLINTNPHTNLPAHQAATSTRAPRTSHAGILGRRSKWWVTATSPNGVQPPWERIKLIHQALEARSYPNASTLAADLGVSAKTIARDLDHMKHRLHLPLKYDSARHGYYYAHPVSPGAVHPVSEIDLFALLVLVKTISQYRGTPLDLPLRSAFQKILRSLDPLELHLVPDLFGPMSVPAPGPDHAILQNFAAPGFSA